MICHGYKTNYLGIQIGLTKIPTMSTCNGYVGSCRCFMGGLTNLLVSKKKDYSERCILGYSMHQMFDVVSNIESYYKFVPHCKRSEVLVRRPGFVKADLVVGFGPVEESYISSVKLVRPHLVTAVSTEGRLFNHLVTTWKFSPGSTKQGATTCRLDFSVSFEFRSALHYQLAQAFFDQVVRQNIKAFLDEAKRRYGRSSIETLSLHSSTGPS